MNIVTHTHSLNHTLVLLSLIINLINLSLNYQLCEISVPQLKKKKTPFSFRAVENTFVQISHKISGFRTCGFFKVLNLISDIISFFINILSTSSSVQKLKSWSKLASRQLKYSLLNLLFSTNYVFKNKQYF